LIIYFYFCIVGGIISSPFFDHLFLLLHCWRNNLVPFFYYDIQTSRF
jgi:hypothetical protein